MEPLQLDVVLALPCSAGVHSRGVGFELAVEISELDVVSDDLSIEAGDPVFDLTASSRVRAPADGAEPVEVLLSGVSTPAGAVSVMLYLLALLGEGPDVPGRVRRPLAEASA